MAGGTDADHIIRFAFDSAEDLQRIGENLLSLQNRNRKADPEKFMAYIKSQLKDSRPYYLLLDEVQMLDGFETVLNGYLRRDKLNIFITGSNAEFLSTDIITEFAGRGDQIHMHPLSFAEFMTVYPGDKYEVSQYMLYGGIPQVVLRDDPQDKVQILNNLFSEIYIRDIAIRHKVRNTGELQELLDIVSSAVGSLTNPEKLKKTFHSVKKSRITAGTISKYLEYLEDSFLIPRPLATILKAKLT